MAVRRGFRGDFLDGVGLGFGADGVVHAVGARERLKKPAAGPGGRAEDDVHAPLVAGFKTWREGAQRNGAMGFVPGDSRPVIYQKRRLVRVVETEYYSRGSGPGWLCIAVSAGLVGLDLGRRNQPA